MEDLLLADRRNGVPEAIAEGGRLYIRSLLWSVLDVVGLMRGKRGMMKTTFVEVVRIGNYWSIRANLTTVGFRRS